MPVPPKGDGGMECLVVETTLSPGTRQAMGGQPLQTGVRKLARVAGLRAPLEVKGIRVSPEGTLAWGQLSVPREQALDWLKASGAEGWWFGRSLLRTQGRRAGKERFSLRWLKKAPVGKEKVKALWESLRDIRACMGGGGWSGFGHQGGFPAGGWAEVGRGTQTEGGGVQGSEGGAEVVVHRERGAAGLCRMSQLIEKFGMSPVGGFRHAKGPFGPGFFRGGWRRRNGSGAPLRRPQTPRRKRRRTPWRMRKPRGEKKEKIKRILVVEHGSEASSASSTALT